MNRSNDKESKPHSTGSLSRRKFIVQVGTAGAFVTAAGIPLTKAFAAGVDQAAPAQSSFWYDAPAKDWKSAIPIGNGRIGGMIFGEVQNEQVLLNESSVWCGSPYPKDNPRGPEFIAQARQLLFDGKPAEAEAACKALLDPDDSDNRCYQPVGFMCLRHELEANVSDYRRWLDYESAVATVRFKQNGVEYLREAFVSEPGQVLVIRLTACQQGKISFSASLDRPFEFNASAVGDNRLRISGQARDTEGGHKGVKFDALVQIINEGGSIAAVDNRMVVSGANSATLLVAVATDYNFKDSISPLTRDRVVECERQLAASASKKYASLKAEHVADFQGLYRRSTLEIPAPSKSDLPIDRRIDAVAKGADDPELLEIYYDYCRYIMISASREGGLPMNLQGIWNPLMAAPWRSNWHLNINVQEAYWFAEQVNLADCHEPFFSLTEELMRNGEVTARVMLGTRRGFAAGHRTDGTLFTAPAGGQTCWAMYVVGGAWCAQHMMEHYRFTQDRKFLLKRALPVLRSAALFWVDWLVPNPKTGKLVSGPAASPENTYRLLDVRQASISMGPSHDQEIAWNSLNDFLEACRALGIANDETREVQATLDRLALPEIAPDGRLREWPGDYAEAEPGHRHISHLWGMMPGHRITLQKTPELAEAVRKSLDYRFSHGYDAQGWSLGWVACMMARLKEGDRALDLISHKYFGQAFPNMFVNAHGQAQVGDMMGMPLAMVELLLQSHTGEIELLPALPKAWPEGKATGLCARGGFILDLTWTDGKLTKAVVRSKTDGTGKFRYKDKIVELKAKAGETYTLSF